MPVSVNIGIAFVAGILSFLSPCVLPLIPSYISLMGGTSLQELQSDKGKRKNVFFGSLFFVIGFSVIFVTLGLLLTTTIGLFGGIIQIINIIAGSIVIVLGINFVFDFWKVLNIEKRFHLSRRPRGVIGSFLFGVAFGAGWSPCVGPILSSILFLAGTGGNFWQALFLLLSFSLGLGLPFLLAGLFFNFAFKQMEKIKPHLNTIRIISGLFLVLIGIMILLGKLQRLNIFLFSLSRDLQVWGDTYPWGARLLFGLPPLLFTSLIVFFYARRVRIEKTASGRAVVIKPFRIALVFLFMLVTFLSFTGLANFSDLLSLWLNFQGI